MLKPGAEMLVTFNSTASPQLRDRSYRVIGRNTLVKTEGPEADIPHYYVTDTEARRLLGAFRLRRLVHQEEIGVDKEWRGCHYYVLAEKPV